LKFHVDDNDEREEYTGRFLDGLFHGKGVLRWRDDLVFTGDFSKGVANGKAVLEVPPSHDYPGSVYVGDYKHNVRFGKGKETWRNGDKYKGDFDVTRHGHGTYTHADGLVYTGRFRKGIWHRRGILACSDHRDDRHRFSYEGDFSNDRFHGQGKATFPNGERYEGSFATGLFHGQGKYSYVNGDVYEGNFVNGSPPRNEFVDPRKWNRQAWKSLAFQRSEE